MAVIRILLADDQIVVRAGLKALIEARPDMRVVGEAPDGAMAVAQAYAYMPDVIVMDLAMANQSGLLAARLLQSVGSRAAMILLGVHDDLVFLRRALAAGACGYLLKRSAGACLIAAIKAAAAGERYLDPALGAVADVNQLIAAYPTPAALSEREEAVLRLIAQGYSNKEIAARLCLSVKTIETYKARAMEKLGLQSRAQIVRYAAALGWLGSVL